MQNREILKKRIDDFISKCDLDEQDLSINEDAFNQLALQIFRYQLENNPPYKKLCINRGVNSSSISHWREIPAVMTTSFKYAPLFCGDPETDAKWVFHTSGTTQSKPGKHYFRTLALYRKAAMRMFKWSCIPDVESLPILVLGPEAESFPNSSLGRMFSWIVEDYGAADRAFCFTPDGIRYEDALDWLKKQCELETPILILATSLALLDFIENGLVGKNKIKLPCGSRIVDTGGYKAGKWRINRADFLRRVSDSFGIEEEWIFNEYGMTEMSSQFYQTRFLAETFGRDVKVAPPWVRSVACDPETLKLLPDGEKGVLRHFDLANLDSVAMLQTEDLGAVNGRTIVLHGRDPKAEPRGCSLLAEEIIEIKKSVP